MDVINDNKSLIKLSQFLIELTKISNEYNMSICGCGCCGSPWILDEEYGKTYENLMMNKDGRYEVDV